MSDQTTSAAFHRTERSGSPSLVLAFAALLIGAAVAFSVLPRDEAGNLIVGLVESRSSFRTAAPTFGLFQDGSPTIQPSLIL